MPDSEPDLSVIIVTADNWSDLRPCLESVYDSFTRGVVEVTCVDDFSRDGTTGRVRQHFPQVQLITNSVKRPYPVTNNQGLAAAQGRYVMLLNDDVVLAPGALNRVVQFLDEHPAAGAASPKLLNPDGTVQPCVRRFPTLGAALAQSLFLHRFWPGNPWTGGYYAPDVDYSQTQPAESIGTTAYVVRRECLEQVGGLDEAFPINFCDLDLNWRIGERGWEVWLVAEAEAVHRGGQTMGLKTLRQLWDFHRGMLRMYWKRYAARRSLLTNWLVLLGICVRFTVHAALRLLYLDRLLRNLPPGHRPGPGRDNAKT